MKRIIFSLLILFSTQNSFAQQEINFNGKILSKNGFVYNVNVINKKIYKGTVSDFEGNFSLSVKANDTITFSCIGFKDFEYIIPDTLQNNNHRVIVQLIQNTVEIGETVVTPWPVNTSALKDAFLDEKPKDEKEAIASYAGFREIEGDPVEPKATLLNPISFIANVFSKKRIQQKKMERFRKILEEN